MVSLANGIQTQSVKGEEDLKMNAVLQLGITEILNGTCYIILFLQIL